MWTIQTVSGTLKLNVKMEGPVEESNTKLRLEDINKYSKLASKEAKERLVKLLQLLKDNQLDPFGFGLRYEATHIHEKGIDRAVEWEELYPSLNFDVNADVTVRSLGAIE